MYSSTPSEGTALIEGFDIRKESSKVRRVLGVVSEGINLYDDLTAKENLELLGRLYNIPKRILNSKIESSLSLIGLSERADSLVKTFSTGMRKKLLIIAALLHDPKILLLDEVTSGLDPQTAVSLRELGKRLCKEENITIIWTTHYIEEPEKICDRVAIIDNGRILALNTPEEIKQMVMDSTIVDISCKTYVESSVIEQIKQLDHILKIYPKPTGLTILYERDKNLLTDVFKILAENNIPVIDVKKHTPTLEEAYLHLTGNNLRGGVKV
jgi:ABC-2 type transport system ATP-binding protein